MYVTRNSKILLVGFFSAKLRYHRITWLPFEIEALRIATSIQHSSPYIIQSKLLECIIKDSKPCVQAVDKVCRGEYSRNLRVTCPFHCQSAGCIHAPLSWIDLPIFHQIFPVAILLDVFDHRVRFASLLLLRKIPLYANPQAMFPYKITHVPYI